MVIFLICLNKWNRAMTLKVTASELRVFLCGTLMHHNIILQGHHVPLKLHRANH